MRYYVANGEAEVYYGDSAIAALAALAATPVLVGEPTVVTFDGKTLRGHSLHELEWDASAERACGDPTYYWPKSGERAPYLREVLRPPKRVT